MEHARLGRPGRQLLVQDGDRGMRSAQSAIVFPIIFLCVTRWFCVFSV
jgi:hypothetical protein